MKAEVIFALPLDEETAVAMIEKAREVGTARLSVILEPGTEGKPRRRGDEAFSLGQDVVELSQEILAVGGAGSFITTRLVTDA